MRVCFGYKMVTTANKAKRVNISHRNFQIPRRSNQSILKEISPGISLEGMMLKLKLQYFGYLMQRVDSLEKTDAGRDWGQEEKGTTEDEMAGWHHWLDGRGSEWTPGVGDGQGGLVCCDSWGRFMGSQRVGHNWATELNWTEWVNRRVLGTLNRAEGLNLLSEDLVSSLALPSAGCVAWANPCLHSYKMKELI